LQPAVAIEDDAGRGDWQPVRPLAGEDPGAGEERLGQPDAPRVVPAGRPQDDDRCFAPAMPRSSPAAALGTWRIAMI
jgi:hypothetical protein